MHKPCDSRLRARRLLQSKRGERGATVHGSNVWALMKAAAEARELELAEVKKSDLCDDPELNQAALESQGGLHTIISHAADAADGLPERS